MYIVRVTTVTGDNYELKAKSEPDLCDGLLNIESDDSSKMMYFNLDNVVCWSEEEIDDGIKTISIFDEDYNEKIHNSL